MAGHSITTAPRRNSEHAAMPVLGISLDDDALGELTSPTTGRLVAAALADLIEHGVTFVVTPTRRTADDVTRIIARAGLGVAVTSIPASSPVFWWGPPSDARDPGAAISVVTPGRLAEARWKQPWRTGASADELATTPSMFVTTGLPSFAAVVVSDADGVLLGIGAGDWFAATVALQTARYRAPGETLETLAARCGTSPRTAILVA